MTGWQDIEAEVLRRIHSRDWPPGSAIPNEADLARDFGVARVTVNRALRSLAQAGWLDRRRKAGTRVALHPVRKAVLAIPILRTEITGLGFDYGYRLLSRGLDTPPADILARMGGTVPDILLHVIALHLADGRPWVWEDRWVNPSAVPAILSVDLASTSANEWLVTFAPFTKGDYAISAVNATPEIAACLDCEAQRALLRVERSTWNGAMPITSVNLVFSPQHRIRAAF